MIKKNTNFLLNYHDELRTAFLVVLFLVAIFVAPILLPQTTHAGGGVGGSGDAGNGSGTVGAYTWKGFGWYNFVIGVESPGGGMKNGNWANVVQTCNSVGAKSVVAFTILKLEDYNGGTPNNNGVIYNYSASFTNIEGWTNYNGNNGGNWVGLADAGNMFNDLSLKYGVDTIGYTWHSNVAWFCWQLPVNNPTWAISTTTAANSDTIPQGGTITWSHTVSNNGLDNTDADVSYYYQNSAGFGNSNTGGNGTLPSGSPKLIPSRSFSSPNTTVPLTTPAGTQFCRKTIATPGGEGGAAAATSEKCVTVTSLPPPANPCRPITVTIPVATYYSTVKHSYNYRNASGNVSWLGRTIDVVLYVDGVEVAYNNSTTQTKTVDLTSRYTDGNTHSVVISERSSHVTGYSDMTHTNHDGDKQVYHPCTRTVTTYGADGKPSGSYKVDCSYYTTDHSKDWTQFDSIKTSTAGPGSYSTKSPIGPCYDYTLTLSLGISTSLRVESGANISINPTVSSGSWTSVGDPSFWNKYRTHTKSKPSKWQVTKMVFAPNIVPAAKAATTSSFDPCSYFNTNPKAISCNSYATNASTIFNAAGDPSVSMNVSDIAPDSAAGTKLCYAVSLYPSQSDPLNNSSSPSASDLWSHASFNPVSNCIIIVKKPKVQIWGGDLRSLNGSVSTSVSTKKIDGVIRLFGSWDEYGIFATGSISGMASGAAFATTSGLASTSSVCSYSFLSFANVPTGGSSCTGAVGSIGNYTISSRSLSEITASFPVGVSTPNITPNLNNLQGIYTGGGNVTISGGNIQKGQWIVINASNANITITGNINYTNGQLHGIADIPQVVIIANSINIADNVTNIDAWLIAKTSINTCSSSVSGTSLTINMCNQPLTVNGPVMTNKLYLHRTAGSSTGLASGDPAEVFNLRPDVYLWSAARANSNGKIQTVYSTELPPRF